MAEWFEEERFWQEMYPIMFPPERMESAHDEIEALLELSGVKEGQALDLCCGPGRHSIALAKNGFSVTGVDRTPFLLSKAKDAASETAERGKRLDIEWVESDMRDFARPETFDLVINLYTSFGYFENPEDDLVVLRNIYKSLKPGAKLILEMIGKEILAKIFTETVSKEVEGSALYIQKHRIVNDWTMIENRWIVLKGGEYINYNFTHRIYSAHELKLLVLSADFRNIRCYGSLNGISYDDKANRLVLVAEK